MRAYIDPEARGGVLNVTPPSLRRLFALVALAFALGLAATVLFRVRVTAQGRGVVRPGAGVAWVRAPVSGTVRSVRVASGQRVSVGEVLFLLDGPVVAPVGGTLDALSVMPDQYVSAGALVAKIIPAGALVGFMAVPARYRAHLAPGQAVRLALDEFPSAEMGFGEGRVLRVGHDLVTPELVQPWLAGIELPPGPSFLVEVALVALPPGARGGFTNGMPFDGVVTVRRQRVLTLLMRPLRDRLGE